MPANPSIDALIASTQRFYGSKSFADQVYNGRKLLAWMKKNGAIQTYDGGIEVIEPLRTSRNTTAQWQASMTEVDFSPQDEHSGASFTAKILTASTVLSWVEKWQNSGSVKVIDLWADKLENTRESLSDLLNTAMITGDGTNPLMITGLPVMVAATGSYGGIARSGNTFWQSYVESTVGPLTDQHIRTGARTVTRGLDNNPANLHLTTQTLYEAYEAMLVPALRFENKNMADLGFPAQSLTWGAAPVIWDDAVTAGEYYFLNTKWFRLRPHSQANMGMTDKLPSKQLVDGLFHYWYGAFTAKGCRYLGKLTGKTA